MDPVTLGVIAIFAGAAGGILNSWAQRANAKAQNQQVQDQLDLMDMQWEESVTKANQQADAEDKAVTLEEAVLGDNVNAEIANVQAAETDSTYSYNNAAASIGQSQGEANAAAAASGTRSSSVLQAAQTNAAAQQTQLQAEEDAERKSQDLSLQSALNSAAAETGQLQTKRDDAAQTRADYAVGGQQYNIYQKQRSNYKKANEADTSLGAQFKWILDGFTYGSKTGSSIASWTKEWGL